MSGVGACVYVLGFVVLTVISSINLGDPISAAI